MSSTEWFVHVEGTVLGPFTTNLVSRLLEQNRLRFVDFAWSPGQTRWVRISELDAFATYLPEYPKIPIPTGRSAGAAAPPADVEPAARKAAPSAKVVNPPPPPVEEEAPSPAVPPSKTRPAAASKIRFLERVPIHGTLSVVGHGNYELVDISEGGVLLRATENIPIGTDVKFTLKSADFPKPLEMTGVVIRHSKEGEPQKGFAVEFTRVNPAHKRALQEYVKARGQGS